MTVPKFILVRQGENQMNIPMKKYGLAGLTLVAALLATVLLVRMASATPDTSTDLLPFNGVTVDGTVAFPDGSLPSVGHPLTDTFVWLHKPDPEHDLDYDLGAYGRSNVNPLNGTFQFARVAPGRYILRAVPKDVPPFDKAPSLPVMVDVFTDTTQPLRLTYPSVTGTVYAPDAPAYITPTQAIVHVYHVLTGTLAAKIEVERRWVWPENNGVFVVGGLPTGTFQFQAEPWPDNWYWWSKHTSVDVTPGSPQSISLTLELPQVVGWVTAPAGATHVPVPEARVRVSAADGTRKSDVTGLSGKFALGELPAGEVVTLTVEPPPGFDWMLPPPNPITTIVPAGPPAAVVPILVITHKSELTEETGDSPGRPAWTRSARRR
jgi:hypothetical protein